ncbi:TPA: hypothetical protein MHN43_08915 [Klebsiella pneumoniae]|nr:hypothetical protein C3483_18075 [Klebsiella pneumoniae]PZA53797.1 hypothetical protein C3K07_12045 [Klebsiella pneumoniae subsp. pneumoniae]OYE22094.1 hypothetical protein CI677_13165 [Klebsiella pneumoniae]PAW14807.1 hypothetical protein CKJ89_21085 [Klebsiella pneumoniae]PLL78129.1 hypothetical protein CWN62_17135 [Klebsiella pneumoniae]
MAFRRLNTVMVFYMLNKIADYELKVVMNFVHQHAFPGRCSSPALASGRALCGHGKRSATMASCRKRM